MRVAFVSFNRILHILQVGSFTRNKVLHVGSFTTNTWVALLERSTPKSVGSLDCYKYSTWVGSLDVYSMSVALPQILHVGTVARKKYSMSVALPQILHVGTVARKKYPMWVASIDLYTLTDFVATFTYILHVGSFTRFLLELPPLLRVRKHTNYSVWVASIHCARILLYVILFEMLHVSRFTGLGTPCR
jgi:hypothetical protein